MTAFLLSQLFWRRCIPLLAIAALACSPPVAGEKTRNAQQEAPAAAYHSSDPALWVLSDDDTTIYFFGSVHMLRPGVIWFDDEVKAAFDRSDELVLEVLKEDPARMAAIVGPLATNVDGPPTSSLLPPKIRALYMAALKEYNLPPQTMDRIDPWLVAINLSVSPLLRMGYRDDLGVEKILGDAAEASGKRVIGLETTEQQLGYFDTLPQKVQIAYLSSTVEDLPSTGKEFAKLMHNWQTGNARELAKQMNESLKETPEMAQALLYDRNARWVKWIVQRMEQPGTVFVAVGAGHLAGKGSVIDLLNKGNLTVRRVSKKDFGLE
tara:strand:+ start:34975 stop:35940 length:966 start_codon:yes stop_codon:yes gene_type:complete